MGVENVTGIQLTNMYLIFRNLVCYLSQNTAHWSGSNVEFEKITQANNLYGCLGIGLRYSEILEFKSKDGGFPNYDHIRFLFYEKIRPRTLK